jgi:hypothetical protein
MKVINYKQLCKEPADTMFATLNKMNELGEVLIIGRYPDDRKFLYSPISDVSKLGTNEIEFDENCFNRKEGTFVVFTQEEIGAYVNKLMGMLSFAANSFLTTLKETADAASPATTCVAPA